MEKNIVRATYAMEKFYEYFEGKKREDIFCITHTDMDGIMAGSIVAKHFSTKNVLMANYGKGGALGFDLKDLECEDSPLKGKDVIFTDYSFSTVKNMMDLLDYKPKSLSIFDHHMNTLELVCSDEFNEVKNRASQEGVELFYYIDTNRCGTKIIFDVLNNGKVTSNAEQKLINLIDLYDRWKFTQEDLSPVYLNEFLYGSTQSYVMSPVVSDLIYNESMERLDHWLSVGKEFYKIKEQMNTLIDRSFSFNAEFHGHRILAIEARGNSSLLGKAIKMYPFIAIFHYDSKKRVFIYSLYKREESDVDILSIAKSYGGGGHICACGFVSEERLITPVKE